MSKGMLICISGFSGAGKGTVTRKLLSEYEGLSLSVSATTRKPREGEIDGEHYFFLDKAGFEKLIREDALLEYAEYQNNYYGTPVSFVKERIEQGYNVILEIEVQGSLKVKEKIPETLLIFLTAPSAKALEERLRGRGTETEEQIRGRLARALQEAEEIEKYDYIVVNDDLETCTREVYDIIMSERHKVARQSEMIMRIKKELGGEK